MRPFILLACLALASCSPAASVLPLVPDPEAIESSATLPSEPVGCSGVVDLSELAGLETELDVLEASIVIAEQRDLDCGKPADDHRQCRALFFLASTEPVLVWSSGASPGEVQQSVRIWAYAVEDGLASSSDDLIPMWTILSNFADGIGPVLAETDEPAIADLVITRGEAVDDLSVLEGFCGF